MSNTSVARKTLKRLGGIVEDIPTSERKEADFLVTFGATKVLIEEKTKSDNPAELIRRSELLGSGGLYAASVPLVRDNRLSGIVRKAAGQLQSSATRPHHFRLIWFTATGAQAKAKYQQFIATLYGTTQIVEKGRNDLRPCYFFRNSDFHRYAEALDGAVAAYISEESITAKLCLNPLSHKYAAIKASDVTRAFGSSIEDPMAREVEGSAFILDVDIDRNDESSVLRCLQEKYGTGPLMPLDVGYCSAEVRYPSERN